MDRHGCPDALIINQRQKEDVEFGLLLNDVRTECMVYVCVFVVCGVCGVWYVCAWCVWFVVCVGCGMCVHGVCGVCLWCVFVCGVCARQLLRDRMS